MSLVYFLVRVIIGQKLSCDFRVSLEILRYRGVVLKAEVIRGITASHSLNLLLRCMS